MPVAWRIVRAKHAAGVFTGEGAARFGERWNLRGVPVVYASGSQALAALEILVHLNPQIPLAYVAFRIEFEEMLIEKMKVRKLPPTWIAEPPDLSSKAIGDAWVRQTRTAVLQVPSALIPDEPNDLFNPAHPDYKNIIIDRPRPFSFDPRLLP